MAKRPSDALLVDGPVKRHLVTLDRASVLLLKRLGGGSLSLGIRNAARTIAAQQVTPVDTSAYTPTAARDPDEFASWDD